MLKQYLIYFVLLLASFFNKVDANWIDEQLKDLSFEEEEALRFFFKKMIKEDHLGHVLFFSNKPACLAGSFINEKTNSTLFLKGWTIWKSKEHLFPHPNFFIFDTSIELGEQKILHIYFINKKTLHACLAANEAILNKKMGGTFSKEQFFRDLEEKKVDAFKDNELLTGVLLGYGTESSHEFKKKKQQPIYCTNREHLEIVLTAKQELIKLKGLSVYPLSFMGNPESTEVKTIQKIYASELEKINALFQKEDLLAIVLHALCETERDADFDLPERQQ